MGYTLSEIHLKLKQLADKMGSDYFVLPVFLNFFETATRDFVGEKLKIIEKTQEVTDDIRPLIALKDISIIEDPNKPGRFIAALPENYLRQVAYDVSYSDGSTCRRADLKRHAEYVVSKLNPNTRPTKNYPIILQLDSTFQIDSGQGAIPSVLNLTYAKKPSFARVDNLNTRVVNLPDDAIDKILKITVTNLFNKTADQRGPSSYQLQETYRKVFK